MFKTIPKVTKMQIIPIPDKMHILNCYIKLYKANLTLAAHSYLFFKYPREVTKCINSML